MSWAETIPFILAAAVFLVLPGGLAAVGLGLRGLMAVAAAPPITVTIAAVLAVALPFLGIAWSSVAILLGGVVLGLALAGVRWASRDSTLASQLAPRLRFARESGWLAASFVVGASLILVQLAIAFGTPASFSQTFDNVFHLNGVRYILETGSASSLTMSSMASGGAAPYFYPAAWHGLAAALIQLTGVALPVGVNLLNMAVAAVMWPLGCMMLTRIVAGNRPVAVASAAVLSGVFSAFPLMLLDFGVLYPNFLSVSMLPASLGAVAVFFGLGRELPVSPWARFGLPLVLIPGVALAHPNGFMSLLVLSVPVVAQSYWQRYVGRHRTRGRALATVGLVGFAGLLIVLWKFIRPPQDAAFWGPMQSALGAAFEVVANSAMNRPVAPAVSILMLVGLALSVRRQRNFWLLACFGITAILFVIVSGTPISDFRSRVTGVWYNDSYRLAALLPLTAVPFAALGVDAIAARLRSFLYGARTSATARGRSGRLTGVRAVMLACGAVLVAAAAVASQLPSTAAAVRSARVNYQETPDSPLVSTDEQAVIDQLPELVPQGSVIAVNPWTGAALAYALADRDTTAKHVLTANSKDVELLNARLRDAGTDPSICEAILRTGVHYVLDFGTKEVHGGNHAFPGLADLDASTSVQPVFRQGNASLYKVTACGGS
ncbi:DUF6541 family protein [Pseudarthrobacter sp. PH31-O2]|uniref:DUF6541 family protein n=1 Tax=Pseudarthrobacter sp. PH31-O2 TaxID=3046206 RepID=UPI0024B9F2B2|nr:DUF6541 family protein [Pseudarthrobacter sp. PH31-O2]MDJ0351158.1 hypothetical protein [Pseudarthrobacter sp. PH31-O2]